MNKKEVQQRVLKNGKPLDLDLFEWDEKTNTFSTFENFLVIDFFGIFNCTFNTGFYCTFNTSSNCTFNTSSDCTFNTDSGCTFKTGLGCTFKTSYNCTFDTGPGCTFKTGSYCVIVRRDIFEVIQQKTNIKLCPYEIPGYLELIDSKWYLNGDKSLGEHIIADNILSKVISKKGNVYRVINYKNIGSDENSQLQEKSYLITDGENWSHGKTLKEARDSLVYKISNRDTSKYKGMKLTTKYTKKEAIKMYRVITGACEGGVRGFLKTIKTKKEKYSVKEIIELTKGQWGNEALINFVKETN